MERSSNKTAGYGCKVFHKPTATISILVNTSNIIFNPIINMDNHYVKVGAMDHILSNLGQSFIGKLILAICEIFDIKKLNSTPY